MTWRVDDLSRVVVDHGASANQGKVVETTWWRRFSEQSRQLKVSWILEKVLDGATISIVPGLSVSQSFKQGAPPVHTWMWERALPRAFPHGPLLDLLTVLTTCILNPLLKHHSKSISSIVHHLLTSNRNYHQSPRYLFSQSSQFN